MGGGALMRIGHNQWTKYYNSNNTISNNVIKNVSRAGIWLGYTENEKVTGNRIYNVTGLGANTYLEGGNPVNYDAGGILAGGDPYQTTWKGFNNIDLLISGNEISNVTSDYIAYGIKVEQSLISYPKTPTDTYFPDRAENTTVMNNIVWGLTTAYSTSRVGIRVFTERVNIMPTNFLNAKVPTYFTTGDKIMNNTVIMPDDEGKTTGGLACIALQHSNGGKILNNAVAMLDNYVDVRLIGSGGSPAASAIFYQGVMPGETNGLESNRNAFWQPAAYLPHEGPSAYGFVELDVDGSFIEPSVAGQYQILGYETLRQWRNWTNQDYNSVIANFTDDLEYTGTSVQYLRVKNPRPFGSVLNDRGFRLTEYLGGGVGTYNYDAFGTQRGVNGQLYDIGAEEFEGQMYLSDVEFQMISSPSAYKSGVGTFSDAEHIMTTLPIDFKVILRNSGNIFQAATKVRLEVISTDAGIHYYDTVTTDIVVSQSKEVTFKIPNSIIKTYSELPGVTVPSRFDPTMKANVTPVYTFKVEVQADENNENNNGEADFRFYIRQSNAKLMVISAEYANTLVENGGTTVRTVDELAGRLNYKALQDAFEKMKLWPRINRDIDYPGDQMDTFKVDVFDRMSWEPKSVDYRMYKYVFWSDRNDSSGSPLALNQLTRYQQWDLREFLDAGTTNNKRNLIIASQEAVRNASFSGDAKAVKFMNETLRAVYTDDTKKGQAFGIGTNCNLKQIKGVALGKDFIQLVKETGAYFDYPTSANRVYDMFPKVGFVSLFTKGEGIAKESHVYPGTTPANLNTGVAMTTLTKNVIYIGIDWRHFGDPEAILRSVMDYYDKNGGTEIPIELADFNAKARTNRVEISWVTESELNSEKFEVEKAVVKEGVKESFAKIAEKAAAGKSSIKLEYGPVVDREVVKGGQYIYRLKMIDKDGRYAYSNERMVEIGGEGLWLGEATPNPVEGIAKFEIATGDKAIEMYVYDVNGREMGLKHEIKDGLLEIDMSGVISGVYTVVLKSGDMMITRQVRVVR
jgi:parallel beta-helix repeat protein